MRPTTPRPPTCSCTTPLASRGGPSRPGASWPTTTRPSTRTWSGTRPSGWAPPPTTSTAATSPCCRTPTSSSTSSAPPQQASEPATFPSPCSPIAGSGARKSKVTKEKPVASEQVLDIPVRRHLLTSERPFHVVLDGIFGGISQPDIGALFTKLAASTCYEEFSALVRQAQGSAGLMRFLQLDLDTVLALHPQAHQAGRRLVRLIAGNPVTLRQMTRHLPASGSYAPVTILIQELPGGQTQVAYDPVASPIAPYGDAAASQVAQRLDTEVLSLLRHATGIPATATAAHRSRRTP